MADRLSGPTITRRSFLIGFRATALLPLLVACSQPTPAAPGATPQTIEVTRVVTQVVQQQVVVTPTAPLAKIGPELLFPTPEGGTVVLDPAQYPTKFNESPLLAQQVAAKKLPPVEQRLPDPSDVLVVKPLNEVGKYGGAIRRGFTGPGDMQNLGRFAAHDFFIYWDYTCTKLVPNVAKSWQLSSDFKSTTLNLRKGMKWSDGQPVTADDIMFWYNDIWNNKDLVPLKSVHMSVTTDSGPVEGTITKVDDYTVRYDFAGPYASFPEQLANLNPITGPAEDWQLDGVAGGIAPAHYLKQFHTTYADATALAQAVKDAKVDNWVALFKLRNNWNLNPSLPCLTAWKPVSPINTSTWVVERNPYFYQVDTAGNQLPYVDQIVLSLAENIDVLNLRAIAGYYDYQDRNIQLANLPVLLQSKSKGDYNVYLDPVSYGSNLGIVFNHSYEEDPEIANWLMNVDFRKALSMAIDRDQINQLIFSGLGTISSGTPAPGNPFYPGDQWAHPDWINFSVDKANALLDQIGLTKKDSSGMRLRTDGKGILSLAYPCQDISGFQLCKTGALLVSMWKKIGIDLQPNSMSQQQQAALQKQNKNQFVLWENNSSEVMFQQAGNYIPVNFPNDLGVLTSLWFDTNGKQGKAPPAGFDLDKVVGWWRQGRTVPIDQRVQLGQNIWKTYVEKLYHIAFVGLAPATLGIHVVKTEMGNIPRRIVVSSSGQTPGNTRPETFYWKS